jgi:hypothetical protein
VHPSQKTVWGRPNCGVAGCHEICDYTVYVTNGTYKVGMLTKIEYEEFDLCGEHEQEIGADFLKTLDLSKIRDQTKEKVVFT